MTNTTQYRKFQRPVRHTPLTSMHTYPHTRTRMGKAYQHNTTRFHKEPETSRTGLRNHDKGERGVQERTTFVGVFFDAEPAFFPLERDRPPLEEEPLERPEWLRWFQEKARKRRKGEETPLKRIIVLQRGEEKQGYSHKNKLLRKR